MYDVAAATKANRLREHTNSIFSAVDRAQWLNAARALGNSAEAFVDLAQIVAQHALDEGATKKAIADALGVPASTFRGMGKTPRCSCPPELVERGGFSSSCPEHGTAAVRA